YGTGDEMHTITTFPGIQPYLHQALSVLGEVETALVSSTGSGAHIDVKLKFAQLPVVTDSRSPFDRGEGIWINSAAGGARADTPIGGVCFYHKELPHPTDRARPTRFSFNIYFDSRDSAVQPSAEILKNNIDALVAAMKRGFTYDFSGGMVADDIRT